MIRNDADIEFVYILNAAPFVLRHLCTLSDAAKTDCLAEMEKFVAEDPSKHGRGWSAGHGRLTEHEWVERLEFLNAYAGKEVRLQLAGDLGRYVGTYQTLTRTEFVARFVGLCRDAMK